MKCASANNIGCLFAVFAAAVLVPLAIVGRHLFQTWTPDTSINPILGWVCLGTYALFAAFNFYLSTIRPRIHVRSGADGYKHISGIPIVHVVFLLVALIALPANVWAGILMLLLLVLDTGAAHWAALAIAREFIPKRG